jgi:hypothetical protein
LRQIHPSTIHQPSINGKSQANAPSMVIVMSQIDPLFGQYAQTMDLTNGFAIHLSVGWHVKV